MVYYADSRTKVDDVGEKITIGYPFCSVKSSIFSLGGGEKVNSGYPLCLVKRSIFSFSLAGGYHCCGIFGGIQNVLMGSG